MYFCCVPTGVPCVSVCTFPMDVIFALDSSSGVTNSDFDHQKNFVSMVTSRFAISKTKTRVGLFTFSGRVRKVIGLAEQKTPQEINAELSRMTPDREAPWSLRMSDMLNTASLMIADAGRPSLPTSLIVLVTGAVDDDVSMEVRGLRELKVQLFVIGVGRNVPLAKLEEIASDKRLVHVLDNFPRLATVFRSVAEKTCRGRLNVSRISHRLMSSINYYKICRIPDYAEAIPTSYF